MTAASSIYLALLVGGIALLALYSRAGSLLKCVLFTAFTGFTALFLVISISRYFQFNIALTPLSAIVSGILGVPGVVGLLVLNLIL